MIVGGARAQEGKEAVSVSLAWILLALNRPSEPEGGTSRNLSTDTLKYA